MKLLDPLFLVRALPNAAVCGISVELQVLGPIPISPAVLPPESWRFTALPQPFSAVKSIAPWQEGSTHCWQWIVLLST